LVLRQLSLFGRNKFVSEEYKVFMFSGNNSSKLTKLGDEGSETLCASIGIAEAANAL
jgi:hypothetical protein